jgi:hypothetical protein
MAPVIEVVALVDLAAGDELCISYCDGFARSADERRKALRESFFFDCACARCEAGGGGPPPPKRRRAGPRRAAAALLEACDAARAAGELPAAARLARDAAAAARRDHGDAHAHAVAADVRVALCGGDAAVRAAAAARAAAALAGPGGDAASREVWAREARLLEAEARGELA